MHINIKKQLVSENILVRMVPMDNKKPITTESPTMWSRDFLLLLAGNLFVYQGFLMLISTFPVYIKQIGGTDLQTSLPFAVVSISALIVRAISGSAADMYGRRPLLILGLTILIITNCSFMVISTIKVLPLKV